MAERKSKSAFTTFMPVVPVLVAGPLALRLPDFLKAAGMHAVFIPGFIELKGDDGRGQVYYALHGLSEASKIARWLKAQGAEEVDTEDMLVRTLGWGM